jgi:hypothetical protein
MLYWFIHLQVLHGLTLLLPNVQYWFNDGIYGNQSTCPADSCWTVNNDGRRTFLYW